VSGYPTHLGYRVAVVDAGPQPQPEPIVGRTVRNAVWISLGVAGVACGLTLLFLGMRSVMRIGGVCASGATPFEISRPCPKGVPLLMIASIWGGLLFTALYAFQVIRAGVPSFLGLIWPALFLSLGWNFLDFGIHPPDESGLVWGWLICAVLFLLMGALPLIPALASLRRSPRGEHAPPGSIRAAFAPGGTAAAAAALSALRSIRSRGWTISRPAPAPAGDDLAADLERLDSLHRSGALSDAEYQAAKDAVIKRADR
jgi:hypothetical protein